MENHHWQLQHQQTLTTVTTIGSCASQTDSGIITVNPLSTISLSSPVQQQVKLEPMEYVWETA